MNTMLLKENEKVAKLVTAILDSKGHPTEIEDVKLEAGNTVLTIGPRNPNMDALEFLEKYVSSTDDEARQFTKVREFVIVPDSKGKLMAVAVFNAAIDSEYMENDSETDSTFCYLDRTKYPVTLGINPNDNFGGVFFTQVFNGLDSDLEEPLYTHYIMEE